MHRRQDGGLPGGGAAAAPRGRARGGAHVFGARHAEGLGRRLWAAAARVRRVDRGAGAPLLACVTGLGRPQRMHHVQVQVHDLRFGGAVPKPKAWDLTFSERFFLRQGIARVQNLQGIGNAQARVR